MILLTELMDKLLLQDEISILELLNIDTEMLLDRFSDLVDDRFEVLAAELNDDDEFGEV